MPARVPILVLGLVAGLLIGLNLIAALPALIQPALDVAVQSDFRAFLCGGDLVAQGRADALYDISAQFEVQRARFPVMTEESQTLAFVNPPFFPIAFAPLSGLETSLAYRLWMLVTALQVGIAMALASAHLGSWGRYRGVVAGVALLALLPTWVTVWQGQSSALLLCGFLGGWLGIRRQRPVLAGLALSLLLIKPQLLPFVGIALLAARQWRALGGLAIGSTVFGIAGTLVVGFHGWFEWLELGSHIVESGAVHGIKPRLMYTGRSLLQVLAGTDVLDPIRIPWGLLLLASAGLVSVVAARTRMRTGAAWGMLATLALLASPHAYLHDVMVLGLPCVALLSAARDEETVHLLPGLLACVAALLIQISGPAQLPAPLGVGAMVLLLVGLIAARREAPEGALTAA